MQYNLVQTEKLSDNEIVLLGKELKVDPNNKELKDRIILSFTGIASSIALHYAKTSRLDTDDLQGEALLAVVTAVNRFPTREHDNLRGYVTLYIHQYCLRFIKKFTPSYEQIKDKCYNTIFNTIELEDMLDFIIQTTREREIIELRKFGLDDNQIANKLGVCRQSINSIRKRLLNRFQRLCNE